MEEIYLYAFRINMLKTPKELVNGFIYVEEEGDLALRLSEEYITRDLLTLFDNGHSYSRLIFWQIVVIVVTYCITGDNNFYLGHDLWTSDKNFREVCWRRFDNPRTVYEISQLGLNMDFSRKAPI